MPTELCRHIHTSGGRCGVLALRGKPLCYFHDRVANLHVPAVQPEAPLALSESAQSGSIVAGYFNPRTLKLPALEDAESIQIAISMVIAAMGQNRLDAKLGSCMLYGLQIASANAARLNLSPPRATIVRDIVTGEDGRQLAPDEDPPPATDGILANLLRGIDKESMDEETSIPHEVAVTS